MRRGFTGTNTVLLNSVQILNRVEGKSFSPYKHKNKESLATDRFEWLNFEQLLYKSVFKELLLARLHKKNNSCKVSRPRARDRDRNPSRPRRDLRPSRPRPRPILEKTETKSRDSIIVDFQYC